MTNTQRNQLSRDMNWEENIINRAPIRITSHLISPNILNNNISFKDQRYTIVFLLDKRRKHPPNSLIKKVVSTRKPHYTRTSLINPLLSEIIEQNINMLQKKNKSKKINQK